MASILCGKCKQHHPSVEMVRLCYAGKTAMTAEYVKARNVPPEEADSGARDGNWVAKDPANFFITDSAQKLADMQTEPESQRGERFLRLSEAKQATEKQIKFIINLRAERGMDLVKFVGTTKQASDEIGRLLVLPKAARPTRGKQPRANWEHDEKLASVPAGRYAIAIFEADEEPADTGEWHWEFFRVTHGKAGSQWEGRVFVAKQAGDEEWPIKAPEKKTNILKAIAHDPKKAAIEYGRQIGCCSICGRTLTVPESIEAGIGPVCASKF